eukprot:jgi/Mesvir1/18974/Mv18940-RA.1
MDLKGQHLAEVLCQYLVIGFAMASIIAGYVAASYRLMLIVYAAGVVISFIICVPDWPYYNRDPITWLTPEELKAKEGEAEARLAGLSNSGAAKLAAGVTPAKKATAKGKK